MFYKSMTLCFVFCFSVSLEAAERVKIPKLVIAEMKAVTTIDPKLLRIIEEQMAVEVGKTQKFSVIGRDDINRMLDSMQQKQMMGCTDISCYVELGGAMGADLMLAGTIDRVGSTYLVTVKLINVTNAEVLAREAEGIKKPSSPEELIEVATTLVERLFALKRPHRSWMWAAAGSSVLTGTTGAFLLGFGLAKIKEAQGMVDSSKSSKVLYTEVERTESMGKTLQGVGYACLGASVGLAVTSVLLWNKDKNAIAINPIVFNNIWGITLGQEF